MANNLPTVSSPLPRDLQQFIQRVREIVNADGADGLVTARQLIAAGVVSVNSTGTVVAPTSGSSSSIATVVASPTAPTNLQATGALANIILTWNSATYSGHAYTEIWAHTSDVVGDAVIVGMTSGNTFAHNIGGSATRYYWARNVNRNGEVSAFNATNGVQGTTSTSPTYILDLLAGEISEGELATDLATRIDLIDDDASVTGSVAARIATETTNRTTAIGGIEAKYTVKIDNAGHLSGYGLISTANDATPTSEFGIRADKFWVAPPAIASATAPASSTRYKGMVWVDESVTPNVIRYWTGSAWSTTPQAFPLVVATSSSTINGVTVDPGVYIDTAMIADATITQAQIGTLNADVINSGLLNTVDFYGNTIAGSTIYLGGTITYTTDSNGNNTGISSVANPNVVMNSNGATFSVNSFKIDNPGGTDTAPFQIVDDVVYINSAQIKDASITDAKISGTLSVGKIPNLTASKITDLSTIATSGSYSDLSDTPDLSVYATVSSLGTKNTFFESATAPTANVSNDLWYDTANDNFKRWDGTNSQWVPIAITADSIVSTYVYAGEIYSNQIETTTLSAIETDLGQVEITQSLELTGPTSSFLAGRQSTADFNVNGFYIGRTSSDGQTADGFQLSHTTIVDSNTVGVSGSLANGTIQAVIHDETSGLRLYEPILYYRPSNVTAGSGQTYTETGTVTLAADEIHTITIVGGGGGGGAGGDDDNDNGASGSDGTETSISVGGVTYSASGGSGGAGGAASTEGRITGLVGSGTTFGAGGSAGTNVSKASIGGNGGNAVSTHYGAGGGGGAGGAFSGQWGTGGSGGGAGEVKTITINLSGQSAATLTISSIGSGGSGASADAGSTNGGAGGNGAGGVVYISDVLTGYMGTTVESIIDADPFGPYGLPLTNSGSLSFNAGSYLGPFTDNRIYYSKGIYSTDTGNNDIYAYTASGTSSKLRVYIPGRSIDYSNQTLGTSATLVDNDFGSGSHEGWIFLGKGAALYTQPFASRSIVIPNYLELRNVSQTFFDKAF